MIKTLSFIPDKVIEQRVSKMLAGFESEHGRITNPPIPIDQLVEFHLDLCFDWDDIDDTDENKILGCLDPSEKKIFMNTRRRDHFEDYIGTEAFTKAHEVGHWDLHVGKSDETQLALPLMSVPEKYMCIQDKKDSREIQAEKYAAYLLMPHHLLMSAIHGLDLMQWHTLYELKDTFGVTISAMKNRLVGMGLIYVSTDGAIYHTQAEHLGISPML